MDRLLIASTFCFLFGFAYTMHALGARVRETAETLGVSTANLIDFLSSDPKVWEQANHLRTHFGHKPLRNS